METETGEEQVGIESRVSILHLKILWVVGCCEFKFTLSPLNSLSFILFSSGMFEDIFLIVSQYPDHFEKMNPDFTMVTVEVTVLEFFLGREH